MKPSAAFVIRIVVLLVALGALFWWMEERRKQQEEAVRRAAGVLPAGSGEGEGEAAAPQDVVRIGIHAREGGDDELPLYWIRLGDRAWDVAYPASGETDVRWDEVRAFVEAAFEEIGEMAADLRRERGDELRGEILVPQGDRRKVPQGLVVRALDALVEAGITEVTFDVTRIPPPGEKR